MTPSRSAPSTAAGRALLEALPRFFKGHAYWRDFEPSAPDRILAIEAEAAAEPTALLRALVDEVDRIVGAYGDRGWATSSFCAALRKANKPARAYLDRHD